MERDLRTDFFISYTSADKIFAEWIAWQLEQAGYTTIFQEWDFRPGSNFVQEMDAATKRAKRTIAVLSPDYFHSGFTPSEWQTAFRRDPKGDQRKLIPVRVRECDVEGLLGSIVYIDLVNQDEREAKARLLAGVRAERAKPTASPGFPTGSHSTSLQSATFQTAQPEQSPSSLGSGGSSSSRRNSPFHGWRIFLVPLIVCLILGGSVAVFRIREGFQGAKTVKTMTQTHPEVAATRSVASSYDAAITKNGMQFGFDAQHTRFNPYEQTLTSTTVKNLKKAWTAQTGNMIYSAPAVANGKVYVGSRDGKFYAFNANGCSKLSCQPLWSVDIGPQVDSSPAIVNGKVYFGADDGKLYAFDAGTGKRLWTTLANSSGISWLTIADDIIYIGTGDGMLQAFNAATGQPKWSGPVGICSCPVHAPAVFNGKIYAGSNDKHLYAFDAGTGKLLWTAPIGDIIDSSLAVANNIVYIGSHNEMLYAFDAGTGKPLWTAPINGYDNDTPAVAYNTVYIGSGDGKLYAFNAQTGKPLWTAPTGDSIFSSPMVANNVVYVGSNDKKLYAFDAQTGLMLWFYLTSGEVRSPPAVANGMVYVGSSDGKLYTFHL